jgi:hypothetical protein
VIGLGLGDVGLGEVERTLGPGADADQRAVDGGGQGVESGVDRVAVGTLVVLLVGRGGVVPADVELLAVGDARVVVRDDGAGVVRVRVVAEADQAEDHVRGEVAVVAVDGDLDRLLRAGPAGVRQRVRVVLVEDRVHRSRVVQDDPEQRLLDGAHALELAILGRRLEPRGLVPPTKARPTPARRPS